MSEESRKNNVKVCVRVRPLSASEQRSKRCIRVVAKSSDPSGDSGAVVVGDKEFTFDGIFGEESSQGAIYQGAVSNLVDGAFEGYNATIFAYGQTGSGKTFSVIGVPQCEEDEGIIPRVIRKMFAKVEECEAKKYVTKLNVRFVEIYNEEFIDLLHPEVSSKDIFIREDKHGNICFLGAKEEQIHKVKDAIYYLERGLAARTTAETMMNMASSRSHAIFTVSVAIYIPDDDNMTSRGEGHNSNRNRDVAGSKGGGGGSFLYSKLHIVDLAGSERAKRTGSEGLRLKESAGINQGLMTLGKVIRALTSQNVSSVHIPYRESKLTRFLQDSLGGNSRTAMLACISPSELNIQETLSTLQYAARTRNIRNNVVANIAVAVTLGETTPLHDESSQVINDLQAQIAKMQAEMQMMKDESVLKASGRAESFTVPRYIGQLNGTPGGGSGGLVFAAISEMSLYNVIRSVNQLKNSSESKDVNRLITSLETFLGTNQTFGIIGSQDEDSAPEISRIFNKLGMDVPLKNLKSFVDSEQAYSQANNEKIIEMLKKELTECKEDLIRDEEIFAEKVRELKKNRTLIRQLQQDNASYQSKIEELNSQLLAAISSSSKAAIVNTGQGEDDLELSIAVAVSEPDISQLMDDLETISREKELIIQEKNVAEERYQQTIQATQKQKFEYEEQKRTMMLNLQRLEDSIYNKEMLIKDLTVNQSKSHASIKQLEDNVAELKESLRELDSERARSNKEVEDAHVQRALYEEKLSKAQSQLKLLRLNFQSQAKSVRGDSKADSKEGGRERDMYFSSIPVSGRMIAERKDSSSSPYNARGTGSITSSHHQEEDVADSKGSGSSGGGGSRGGASPNTSVVSTSSTSTTTATTNPTLTSFTPRIDVGESKSSQQQDDLQELNRQYSFLKEQYVKDEMEYTTKLNGLISQIDLYRLETEKSQKQIESLEKKNNILKMKVLQYTSNSMGAGSRGGEPGLSGLGLDDLGASLSLSLSIDPGALKSMLLKMGSAASPTSGDNRDKDRDRDKDKDKDRDFERAVGRDRHSVSTVNMKENAVIESISSLLNSKIEGIVSMKKKMKDLYVKNARSKVCESGKQEILHEIENILQSIRDKELAVKRQMKEVKSKLKPLIQDLQSIKDRSQGDLGSSGLKSKAVDLFHEIKIYQDHYEELQSRHAEYQSAGKYHPTILELQEELESLETEIGLNNKFIYEESSSIIDTYFSKTKISLTKEQISSLYSDDNSIDLIVQEKISALVNDIVAAVVKKTSLNSTTAAVSPLNSHLSDDENSFQVEKSESPSRLVAYASVISFFRLLERWDLDNQTINGLKSKVGVLQSESDESKATVSRTKIEMANRLEQLHFEHEDKVKFLLQQLKDSENYRSVVGADASRSRPTSSGSGGHQQSNKSNKSNKSDGSGPSSSSSSEHALTSSSPIKNNATSLNELRVTERGLELGNAVVQIHSPAMSNYSKGNSSNSKSKQNLMSLSIEAAEVVSDDNSLLQPVSGAIHQEVLRRLQTEKDRRELLEKRYTELSRELRTSNTLKK